MRENDARNRIVKITLERLHEPLGGYPRDKGMLPLPEHLHTVMRKMLEETIERKPGSIDVNLAQLAVEIGVFVDKTNLQPVGVF